jgi:hypothetical protein
VPSMYLNAGLSDTPIQTYVLKYQECSIIISDT